MIGFLRALGRFLVRAVGAVIVIAVVMAAYHSVEETLYQRTIPMGEVTSPDEDAVMPNAIAMALVMINNTRDGLIDQNISGDATFAGKDYDDPDKRRLTEGHGGPVVYRRDVHIKSHGCVKANFTVLDVENKYRWGVFAEPKTFPAWIRYSNGDYLLHPDSDRDARGMAIKLMNVPGKKLLAFQSDATTQDFVMMNSTVYFVRHLADYVELTKYLAVGDNFGYFLNGWSWNPLTYRYRELRLVASTKKKPPETPLLEQYFSASAYALGPDHYIKFSAKPKVCSDDDPKPPKFKTSKKDYNFLRLRMDEQLKQGPACFDFMVQMQVPGKVMPVEDATIEWEERDSPFVPVAHIEIPMQAFDTEAQNRFCENLSFNPWHSLQAHRPVGVFNRVRKALYEEVAKYRWDANRRQYEDPAAPAILPGEPPEPDSWCIGDQTGNCAPTL